MKRKPIKAKIISYSLLLLFLLVVENQVMSTKLSAMTTKKAEEDLISDKELDALLKDPKYASLAGDLIKPTDAKTPVTEKPKSHYMSASYKEHLERTKKAEKKSGVEDLDLLSKSLNDPLKDLELISTSEDKKKENKKEKKDDKEEKFKNFDFINKSQARYLIEVLKQPVFLNMLPPDAQQIVKTTVDNFSFKFEENNKINEFIETSLVNSPTSQSFVDPDGIIGRKGVLTLIDPETGDSKFVWTVSNSKVLTFFQSQSLLTIVKLYRNSRLNLKDIPATPCFLITHLGDSKDGSVLVCATTTQEKEVWVQTINSHLTNFGKKLS